MGGRFEINGRSSIDLRSKSGIGRGCRFPRELPIDTVDAHLRPWVSDHLRPARVGECGQEIDLRKRLVNRVLVRSPCKGGKNTGIVPSLQMANNAHKRAQNHAVWA